LLPHAPQLILSVMKSTQVPAHCEKPELHCVVHWLFEHSAVAFGFVAHT
jgi:hypothetical protein